MPKIRSEIHRAKSQEKNIGKLEEQVKYVALENKCFISSSVYPFSLLQHSSVSVSCFQGIPFENCKQTAEHLM